ncbi:MAG: sugar ABC transporter ATP-binding protein, partial [Desulfobacteraceae bacterium]|nr:sugar ABC transporter ATP-binding protein [Desulfobacteraceae bacterium]
SKRFGQVQALLDVDLSVIPGEVVGLVGDNGAGKATLMKILAGAIKCDEGTITIDGQEHVFSNPNEAHAAGIEMLYQDLALFDDLSVIANIFVGREVTNFAGFLRFSALRNRASEIVDAFSVRHIDVNSPVGNLSGGQRQVSALARTVGFGSRYVVLDEPTSALSPSAAQEVLDVVRGLAEKGIGVIMVSHNLNHVISVCDRVAVLHLGRMAGIKMVKETTQEEVVSLIVKGE